MRFVAVVLVLVFVIGCKSPSSPESGVQFVQWTAYGPNGSTGLVKNYGTTTAHHVYVKTQTPYETVTGNSDPYDLAPGATGTFSGAGSGPGVSNPPTILKIGWD